MKNGETDRKEIAEIKTETATGIEIATVTGTGEEIEMMMIKGIY